MVGKILCCSAGVIAICPEPYGGRQMIGCAIQVRGTETALGQGLTSCYSSYQWQQPVLGDL